MLAKVTAKPHRAIISPTPIQFRSTAYRQGAHSLRTACELGLSAQALELERAAVLSSAAGGAAGWLRSLAGIAAPSPTQGPSG